MKLGEILKGSKSEDSQKKMAQSLLSSLKQRKKDEFTRDEALETYATSLGLRGKNELQESQKLHVGRLLAKLSKQHDVHEIADRYIFPPEKDTLH